MLTISERLRIVLTASACIVVLLCSQWSLATHAQVSIAGPSVLCDESQTGSTLADIEFVRHLQKAIQGKDLSWLANHIDFPLVLALAPQERVSVLDAASLKAHLYDVFPPVLARDLSAIAAADIKRTSRGIELGTTGIVCLPVPRPGNEGTVDYLIYRVSRSAPSERTTTEIYTIDWTDMVFFIQFKEALREGDAKWVSSQIQVPFVLCNNVGGNATAVSRPWLLNHFEEIWRGGRDKPLSKKTSSEARGEERKASLSQALLKFATTDLWANWRGVMADNGTIWFSGEPQSNPMCYKYSIDAINPLGHAQELDDSPAENKE